MFLLTSVPKSYLMIDGNLDKMSLLDVNPGPGVWREKLSGVVDEEVGLLHVGVAVDDELQDSLVLDAGRKVQGEAPTIIIIVTGSEQREIKFFS